jgi:hypothetical protein
VARPEIEAGSVITAIDGRQIGGVADLASAAKAARASGRQSLVLRLEVNGEQRLSLVKPVYGDLARDPLPELPKSWVGVEVQPFTGSLAKDIGLANPGFRISRIIRAAHWPQRCARIGDLLVSIDVRPLKPGNDISAEDFDQQVHDLSVGLRRSSPRCATASRSSSRSGAAFAGGYLRPAHAGGRAPARAAARARLLRPRGAEAGHRPRRRVHRRRGERRRRRPGAPQARRRHRQPGRAPVDNPTELSAALEQALAAPGTGLIPCR